MVSIVIVNYNELGYLRRNIISLIQSDYSSFEIIIVDNGSSDGSVSQIQREFAEFPHNLVILPLPRNYGFSEGNNIGAKKAKGDYLFFLNNDTEVDSSCLKVLANLMQSDPSIGVAQAKLLRLNQPETFDCAGGFLNVIGVTCSRGDGEKDRGQYDKVDEISYAKGAAMIVRRDLWTKLNGFDLLFFAYFEEADFCWRAWLAGYRVVFVPSAKVYHASKATISKFRRLTTFQESRNRIITVLKNLEFRNLIKYSPFLPVLYSLLIIQKILKCDVESLLDILQGIVWCLKHFDIAWIKRLEDQRMRVVNDDDIFRRGVISQSLLPRIHIHTRGQ
jgi:GT2 family glycosyltransferase